MNDIKKPTPNKAMQDLMAPATQKDAAQVKALSSIPVAAAADPEGLCHDLPHDHSQARPARARDPNDRCRSVLAAAGGCQQEKSDQQADQQGGFSIHGRCFRFADGRVGAVRESPHIVIGRKSRSYSNCCRSTNKLSSSGGMLCKLSRRNGVSPQGG